NGGNTTKARRERRFFPNSQTLRAFVSTTKSPQPIDKPRRLFTKPSCFRVYQKEALPTDGTPRRLEGTKVFSQISQNPFVFSCLRRKALNGPTKPRRLEGSEDSFQIHKAFELSCLRRKALNGPTNHEGLEGSESSSQIHKPFVSCLRRKTLNGPTTTKARRNEDSFRIHRPSRFRDRHARPGESRPVQRSRCLHTQRNTTKTRRNEDSFRIHRPSRFRDWQASGGVASSSADHAAFIPRHNPTPRRLERTKIPFK